MGQQLGSVEQFFRMVGCGDVDLWLDPVRFRQN